MRCEARADGAERGSAGILSVNWLRKAFGFFISTDRRIPADPLTHKTYLVLTLAMLIAPIFLSVGTDASSTIQLGGYKFPPACPSERYFHVQCPGCGMTHAFVCITHGQIRDSFHWNRVGLLLYLFFVYQVIFRIYILRNRESIYSLTVIDTQYFISLTMIALLILNWGGGFYLGSNGS